jgi:hypothetical protein
MVMAGVGVLLSVSRYSHESVTEKRTVRRQARAMRRAQPVAPPPTPEPALTTRMNEGQST